MSSTKFEQHCRPQYVDRDINVDSKIYRQVSNIRRTLEGK